MMRKSNFVLASPFSKVNDMDFFPKKLRTWSLRTKACVGVALGQEADVDWLSSWTHAISLRAALGVERHGVLRSPPSAMVFRMGILLRRF